MRGGFPNGGSRPKGLGATSLRGENRRLIEIDISRIEAG